MRKVILYIANSLDHYIARDDGSLDWLSGENMRLENEDYGYQDFYDRVDTLLMGHNTWRHIKNFEFPYPGKQCYVFSRSKRSTDQEEVEFISEDPVAFTRSLLEQKGKSIWLVGGGEINSLLMRAGLVDELILTTVPVTLGSGMRLFGHGAGEHDLHLLDCEVYENGVVQLIYTLNDEKEEEDSAE